MLPTQVLRSMLGALSDIDHLNFIRIGSKAPVSYPIRFLDDELIEFLAEFNRHKTLFVPTHFNHSKEITKESRVAVRRIRSAGITVNNDARQQVDGYAKRFKVIIGHDIGQLEICGRVGDKLLLKQIHAGAEHEKEASGMFVRQLTDTAGCLEDLSEIIM